MISKPDENEISFDGLVAFDTVPPPSSAHGGDDDADVHSARTAVAELPDSFLDSLKVTRTFELPADLAPPQAATPYVATQAVPYGAGVYAPYPPSVELAPDPLSTPPPFFPQGPHGPGTITVRPSAPQSSVFPEEVGFREWGYALLALILACGVAALFWALLFRFVM
jgi:hypothetical protein